MANKINAAIFVRVSSRTQDAARQIDDLTELSKKQGWILREVITEKISGSAKNSQRPGLQKLMTLANTGQIQKVVVSEVSRLGRNTREVLEIIDQLSNCKTSIYIQNYNLETLTPTGKVNSMAQFMLTLLAEFARLEREDNHRTDYFRTAPGLGSRRQTERKTKGDDGRQSPGFT